MHVLTLLCPRFFADFLAGGYPPGFWYTMRTFYDGDGYPSLGLYFKAFDVAVSCLSLSPSLPDMFVLVD